MDFVVLTVVIAGRLAGEHHIFCGSVSGDSDGGEGGGMGGSGLEVCGRVLCVVGGEVKKIPVAGQIFVSKSEVAQQLKIT